MVLVIFLSLFLLAADSCAPGFNSVLLRFTEDRESGVLIKITEIQMQS